MLAAKFLPPVFAFVVHVSIARLAGAETLGGYVSLLAVLMIFQAVAGAGMQFLLTRDIATQPERAATHVHEARRFAVINPHAAQILALEPDGAGLLEKPHQRIEQRCLAGTIGADHGDHAAHRNIERDAADRFDLAVGNRHPVHDQQRLAHATPPR